MSWASAGGVGHQGACEPGRTGGSPVRPWGGGSQGRACRGRMRQSAWAGKTSGSSDGRKENQRWLAAGGVFTDVCMRLRALQGHERSADTHWAAASGKPQGPSLGQKQEAPRESGLALTHLLIRASSSTKTSQCPPSPSSPLVFKSTPIGRSVAVHIPPASAGSRHQRSQRHAAR